MDDFSITGITRYLRDIISDDLAPIADDDTLNAPVRELIHVLNELNEDRRRHRVAEQRRNRLIIDSTPIAICITNAHGLYEYSNPRYRELSGEWAIVSKDGRHIPILANAAYVIDVDGEPKKITFVVDITDMIRARDQLSHEVEERRRLEHMRDTVERMLQHDLRNPIDGIRTAAEFLLEDDLGERPNEFVRLMYDAAGRARNRIDSSLAYTQMEQGSYQLDRIRVNVVHLIRDVEREMRDLLVAYRTDLRTLYHGRDLRDRYDVELWGETDFLQDALTNLIRNAVEAGQLGVAETVTVEVGEYPDGMGEEYPERVPEPAETPPSPPVPEIPGEGEGTDTDPVERLVLPGSVAFSPEAPVVSIDVRNRADIPVEIRGHLFDPYVTFGKSDGTGLGTYTAMLIARAHGGAIVVHTGGGGGTRVNLLLPRGRISDER